MLDKIGWVSHIDFDAHKTHLLFTEDRYKRWVLPVASGGESDDCIQALTNKHRNERGVCLIGNHDELFTYVQNVPFANRYEDFLLSKFEAIKRAFDSNLAVHNLLEVVDITGRFVVVKYAVRHYITLLQEFVDIHFAEDYSQLAAGELAGKLTDGKSSVISPALSNSVTLTSAKDSLLVETAKLQSVKTKLEEQYNLARKEMERKLAELKAEQEKQLSILRERVEQMKDTVFVLEENIFALRSLFGETFSLLQLTSGRSSKTPLVLYQKFRFCDEEFALLGSRGFDGSHGTVAQLFHNRVVRERFLPADKCITFFRVSKDNKAYSYDVDADGLVALEYYHGDQIGMLIRNGDNTWLSFIDEEVFVEDNLFESPSSHLEASKRLDSKSHLDPHRDVIVLGETRVRDPISKAYFNKVQLFNVLRGLVSCTNIFPELKGVDILNAPTDLVVFSAADNQLATSKYPSFKDYFSSWRDSKLLGDLRVGDPILVVTKAAATFSSNSPYREDSHRSRGWANRARDADDIEPGINRLSFIESEDEYYELMVNEAPYKRAEDNNGKVVYYRRSVGKDKAGEPNVICEPKYTYYISAERHPWDFERMDAWGNLPSRVNRVNLHIYADEFCPVVYINSNYVQSWMEQKNLGNWNGSNYVYLTEHCFHPLMKFLREREAAAVALVKEFIPTFTGNPQELDSLLDWQKSVRVKNITKYQAKRFANWYKSVEVN